MNRDRIRYFAVMVAVVLLMPLVNFLISGMFTYAKSAQEKPKEDCEWMYQKAREFGLEGVKSQTFYSPGLLAQSITLSTLYLACRERQK